MDTVGGAIRFSIPVVSTAYIFHTALAIPAADHRNERIPTFLAGQQSRVTVLGLIAVCGASLLFEQALYLLPFLFFYDHRKEPLMTIPVGFVYMLGFSVIILPAMVVQHTGVRFFHQNVLHAGIFPASASSIIRLKPSLCFVFKVLIPSSVYTSTNSQSGFERMKRV